MIIIRATIVRITNPTKKRIPFLGRDLTGKIGEKLVGDVGAGLGDTIVGPGLEGWLPGK